MKKVRISNLCYDYVCKLNVDYCLSEILGLVDYKFSSRLEKVNINTDTEVKVLQISEETYDEILENFKSANNVDQIVEMLLWTYLLVGRNI